MADADSSVCVCDRNPPTRTEKGQSMSEAQVRSPFKLLCSETRLPAWEACHLPSRQRLHQLYSSVVCMVPMNRRSHHDQPELVVNNRAMLCRGSRSLVDMLGQLAFAVFSRPDCGQFPCHDCSCEF